LSCDFMQLKRNGLAWMDSLNSVIILAKPTPVAPQLRHWYQEKKGVVWGG